MLLLITTSGCSTLLEGTTQKVTINTDPEGASCQLRSNDDVIAEIPLTPAVVTVSKSKYDIVVECTKPGYVKGKKKDHSDYAITTLGNLALVQLSFVGNMVDSASGASNKYDDHVLVALAKAPVPVAQAPAQQAAQNNNTQPLAEAGKNGVNAEAVQMPTAIQQQVAFLPQPGVAVDGLRQPPYDMTQ